MKNGHAPDTPLPVARELGETSLAYLVDPSRERTDMQRAAEALLTVIPAATRDGAQAQNPSAAMQ